MSVPLGSGGRIERGDEGPILDGAQRFLRHQPVSEAQVASPIDPFSFEKPVPRLASEEIIPRHSRFSDLTIGKLRQAGLFVTKVVIPWAMDEDYRSVAGFGLRIVDSAGSFPGINDLPRITEAAFDPRLLKYITSQPVDINPSEKTTRERASRYGNAIADFIGAPRQEIAGVAGSGSEVHEVLGRFHYKWGKLPDLTIFSAEAGGNMLFRLEGIPIPIGGLGLAFRLTKDYRREDALEIVPVLRNEHPREGCIPRIGVLPLIMPRGTVD